MSANPGFTGISETISFASARDPHLASTAHLQTEQDKSDPSGIFAAARAAFPPSPWSSSVGKRLFDIVCVLAALPLTLPAFLIAGLAVRLTSRGPVLFRQQRMGRHGQLFTIFKFRTMPVRRNGERPAVTTCINQRFTPVGPFLRRWKLDELPQLLNVLRGEMSLVGPRPKLPKHQTGHLSCRPGITGRATMVFAREEIALSSIPSGHLDSYYHSVILPLKQMLDEEYMAHATFSSDLKLILKSVLRNWDDVALTDLLSLQPHLARFAMHTHVSVERLHRVHSAPVVLSAASSPLPEIVE